MAEKNNMSEVVSEIKNATEEDIKEVVEKWFEKTRTDGMRLGAQFIAAGCWGAIQKNLSKPNPSLRDHKRCIEDIRKIIAVQLYKKNESNATEVVEDTTDDGAVEDN
jgi:hypothetical protein